MVTRLRFRCLLLTLLLTASIAVWRVAVYFPAVGRGDLTAAALASAADPGDSALLGIGRCSSKPSSVSAD